MHISEPILPDGSVNWACQCIEKEVIGPCNVQFRALREFMHVNKVKDDPADLPDHLLKEFDKVLEGYVTCTMDYPVYYMDSLLDEEIEDLEREKQELLAKEQRRQQDREQNTLKYGRIAFSPLTFSII